jgi:NADH-quinone oxidoreductase subunit M
LSLLAVLTLLPLAGALLLLALPIVKARTLRLFAFGITLVVAVLGIAVWWQYDPAQAGSQLSTRTAWFTLPEGTPVRFTLAVDGISILMVLLTVVLMPIVVLSTPGHVKSRVREFMVWLLVMETGMLGVFLALDLVLFYFFWEVSLVPLYFLVGIWGGERRLYATVKFFLYTFAGSLVMLVAVIALIYRSRTCDVTEATQWAAAQPLHVQLWLFAGFAIAFAIKVPLLPFHTWLADAHTEAPTSGSVILAGVLLKMGTYGLLRFGVSMFPAAAIEAAPLMMTLGAAGIAYGAFLAMAQTDVKRLIACSSVSHLGYVVLGLFALTPAGLRGGVLQMVNHGLSTGLLFLLVGMLYERRHTRAIEQYGGIASSMPVFALFFVLAMLSSVGLPGLNGFVGEWMILLGAFQSSPFLAVVGTSGVILGAVYLLSATRRILFGPLVHEENRGLSDLGIREVGLMVPLVLLCVWIGIRPNNFIGASSGSIDLVIERVERARETLKTGSVTPRLEERPESSGEDRR